MANIDEAVTDNGFAGPVEFEALPDVSQVALPGSAPVSMVKTAVAIGVITLLAMAAGGLYGIQAVSTVSTALEARAKAAAPVAATRYAGTTSMKDLAPIITNLAQPENVWVRLEASLVFDSKGTPMSDLLTGEITGDILAYLRTVTLTQIEGASGLRQLREDLNERVAIRSEGRVRELIIQTLVVQ